MLKSRLIASFVAFTLSGAAVPSSALAFAPPPAPTEGPATAPDEVRLVSGGFVRGEITEYMPGEYLVIVPRGSTESRRIAWDTISEVVRGGKSETVPTTVPEPTPVPEPEPQPQPELTPPGDGDSDIPGAVPGDVPAGSGPLIHIEQTRDKEKIILYHIDGEAVASGGGYVAHAVAYSEICEAPCDVRLGDTRGEFFVNGQKKYSPSKRFRLPGNHDAYQLDVRPGLRGMRIGGYVLSISAVCATVFMAMGPYLVDMPKRPNAVGTWVGAGLVGTFGIGGGIAMMILGRSKVTVRPR